MVERGTSALALEAGMTLRTMAARLDNGLNLNGLGYHLYPVQATNSFSSTCPVTEITQSVVSGAMTSVNSGCSALSMVI